jgi:hypothetical protein
VTDYRAYTVGDDGHFDGVEPLICANDDDAVPRLLPCSEGKTLNFGAGRASLFGLPPTINSALLPIRVNLGARGLLAASRARLFRIDEGDILPWDQGRVSRVASFEEINNGIDRTRRAAMMAVVHTRRVAELDS